MNKILLAFLIAAPSLWAQVNFNTYFEKKTLRVDFDLVGNSDETDAYLYQLIEEPYWGGRQHHLDESLRLGDFIVVLKDTTDKVIYEEGFATLFEEWQGTEEARVSNMTFQNSIIMPYPKHETTVSIIRREEGYFTDTLMVTTFIPNGKNIVKNKADHFSVDTIMLNQKPENALDIVILGEGFTKEEMAKFKTASKNLSKTLMTSAVFKENKKAINIYAVNVESQESGANNPTDDIWVNNYFNASFNTLYSERYLMSKDIRKVRDAASLVPYDQIYILVNTEKYGGGGIYNYFSICSAYGVANQAVLIHEFGHSFAALADEYYYDDGMEYIDLDKEPWQKNITTLVSFDQKWADKIVEDTPIPTPEDQVKDFPIGVYEGAAYVSKGVYRACPDCRMKTNTADDFCPVCKEAINEVIDLITKE